MHILVIFMVCLGDPPPSPPSYSKGPSPPSLNHPPSPQPSNKILNILRAAIPNVYFIVKYAEIRVLNLVQQQKYEISQFSDLERKHRYGGDGW